MIHTRLRLAGFVAASVLLTITACHNASPPEQPSPEQTSIPNSQVSETIRVVTNRTDMIDKEYTEYARRFHDKYPAAKVQFEALRDYDKNIKIQLASGETPDVLLIPTLPNADLGKFFAPLNDIEFESGVYFGDFKSEDGKTYGIPSGIALTGVVYNKRAFEKAGIGAAPRTLDEFYQACDKLKASGIVPFASNFKDRWPLQVWSIDVPVLLAGDAGIKNELAKKDEPFQRNNPYVASMDIIKEMSKRGYLEPNLNDTNWESSKKDVAGGKTGMMLTGSWTIQQIVQNGANPEDIGFFPFPADNSGKLKVLQYPDRYYAVGKNSKHAATAKAFIKWMIEESGYDQYSGFTPVLKDRSATLPQLAEINSYHPAYIQVLKDSDLFNQVQNKTQLEMTALVQEYLLGIPEEVLAKYNLQWSQARRSVMASP